MIVGVVIIGVVIGVVTIGVTNNCSHVVDSFVLSPSLSLSLPAIWPRVCAE